MFVLSTTSVWGFGMTERPVVVWSSTARTAESGESVRPATTPVPIRDQWMAVPRGTPEAPSPVGAAFPQVPSRGEAATQRGGPVPRYDNRPGTTGSYRRVLERREKYQRPETHPSSLKERILRLEAEEAQARQQFQEDLESSSRFCTDRRKMQKNLGATALYVPEATLLRAPKLQESNRQQLAMNPHRRTSVVPASMPFSPLRTHRAGPQRGWLV